MELFTPQIENKEARTKYGRTSFEIKVYFGDLFYGRYAWIISTTNIIYIKSVIDLFFYFLDNIILKQIIMM